MKETISVRLWIKKAVCVLISLVMMLPADFSVLAQFSNDELQSGVTDFSSQENESNAVSTFIESILNTGEYLISQEDMTPELIDALVIDNDAIQAVNAQEKVISDQETLTIDSEDSADNDEGVLASNSDNNEEAADVNTDAVINAIVSDDSIEKNNTIETETIDPSESKIIDESNEYHDQCEDGDVDTKSVDCEEDATIELMADLPTCKYYKAAAEGVPVRKKHFASGTVVKRLYKGELVEIVDTIVNSKLSLWHKTKDGYWIFSGNLSKIKCNPSDKTEKTTYEQKNNNKHVKIVTTSAVVCTRCNKTISKQKKEKSNENHKWIGTGVCKNCKHVFEYSEEKGWPSDRGQFLVKESTNARTGPYQDCDVHSTLKAGDLVNIECHTNNAYGSKWYKATNGMWIYESYIEKHDCVSYSDTGYCSCGKAMEYSTIQISTVGMELSTATSARKIPFPSATATRNLSKGTVLNLVAKDKSYNPKWYKTADGDWILASKVKNHIHSYNGGICKNTGCGYEFPLNEKALNNGKAVQYETTGDNKAIRIAPYSERDVISTVAKAGTVISVTHKAINSKNNLWYKTSEGRWIFSDNIKPHSHKTSLGKCVSPGCNYDYGVRPATFSPTTYIVIEDNVKYFSLPYKDSQHIGTYSKYKCITINAEFINAHNNKWYRMSNGYWIYSDDVKQHSHTYEKGVCTVCENEYPLCITQIEPTIYVTKFNDVSVWSEPYYDTTKKRTIKQKGSTVTVVAVTKNSVNHTWYKTSQGDWIFDGNIEMYTETNIVGPLPQNSYYVVNVRNEYGVPISGATVTFGSQSAVTDENGYVQLLYSNLKDTLTISASEYTTCSEIYQMNSYRADTITLVKKGSYALTKAVLTRHGESVDIKNTEVTINQAANNLKFDITLDSNLESLKEYRLVQNNVVKHVSTNGLFEGLVADDFDKDITVYAQAVDTNGVVKVNAKLMINVIYSYGDTPANISLGKDFEISLPESAPFPFSGMAFSMSAPICPISVDINDESIRLGINFKLYEYGDNKSAKESRWQQIKRLNKNKFKGFYEKNAINIKDDIARSSPFSLDVKVGGYAETTTDLKTFKGRLFISIGCEGYFEKQFPSGPVPLVFEFSYEAKVEADGYITVTKSEQLDGNLGITIEGGVGVYLGLGVAGMASLGVYGKVTLGMETQIIPEMYIDSVYVNGSVGAKAKVLGKNVWDATIMKFGNLYIYRRGIDLASDDGNNCDVFELMYSEESYVPMDRSYLNDRSEWYEDSYISLADDEDTDGTAVSQFDFEVMQKSTYTDIRPQLVSGEFGAMMVYLDDNPSRTDADRTMLVYSIYNSDIGRWSEPKPVSDDGTADFNFNISSNNGSVYIVWQNSNCALSDQMSISEIGKCTDISIAKYDHVLDTFVGVERVTADNDKFELMPRVAGLNGQTIVAWFENSEDDVFGSKGFNTVKYAVKSEDEYCIIPDYCVDDSGMLEEGTELDAPVDEEIDEDDPEASYEEEATYEPWFINVVDGQQPSITSLATGYMLDYGYIAFTIDADGNTITVDDQEIKLIDLEYPEIISYTNRAMNVEFTKVHGDNAMTWFNNGYIYYSLDAESAPQILYSGSAIPADEYHIISSDSGDMSVLYTLGNDEGSDAYMLLYDDSTYEWGFPVRITKQSKYIRNFNGAYCDNAVVTVFNQTDVTGEDMLEKNSFCCAVVGQRHDLVLEDVDFEDFDLEPLKEYPITAKIRNNGTVRVSDFLVTVYNKDEIIVQKLVESTVKPGEIVEVELPLTMPEEIVPEEYILFVEHSENDNDADISNNSHALDVGKALFKISADSIITGNRNIINISVINTGYQISGGSIVLYNEDFEVERVLYENIDEIGNNNVFSCSIEVSNEDFDGQKYKSFCIGVIPDAEQYTSEFNSTFVTLKNAVAIESPETEVTMPRPDDIQSDTEFAIMADYTKTFFGSVKNETENYYENAQICVVSYDARGIYLDTQIIDVSMAPSDSCDFEVTFETNEEIGSVRVMLLDKDSMSVLSDYSEILLWSPEDDIVDTDEHEMYDKISDDSENAVMEG